MISLLHPRPTIEGVPSRPAAFFDLDKTIIARSSTLAFSRPFYQGGLINRRAVLRSAYAQFVYLMDGADHDQMERMRAYLSALCRGLGRRAGRGDRRRDPARPHRPASSTTRPPRSSRSTTPPAATSSSSARPAPRSSSRSARCSAPTTSSPRGWSSRTAATPARSSTTRTARPRPRRSASWPASEGYDLAASFAYSDSATDLPMLEAVGPSARGQPRQGAAESRRGTGVADSAVRPAGGPAQALPGCGCEHAAEGCRSGGGQRGSRRHRLVRPPAQPRGELTSADLGQPTRRTGVPSPGDQAYQRRCGSLDLAFNRSRWQWRDLVPRAVPAVGNPRGDLLMYGPSRRASPVPTNDDSTLGHPTLTGADGASRGAVRYVGRRARNWHTGRARRGSGRPPDPPRHRWPRPPRSERATASPRPSAPSDTPRGRRGRWRSRA